jgi:hypothetical protein
MSSRGLPCKGSGSEWRSPLSMQGKRWNCRVIAYGVEREREEEP